MFLKLKGQHKQTQKTQQIISILNGMFHEFSKQILFTFRQS